MDKALLDTDILSEVLKARDASVVSRAADYQSTLGRLTISTITVMEVVKGLHKVAREDALQQFLEGLETVEVLPFEPGSAVIAGRIFADLEIAGQLIGRADVMIAAIAIQHDLVLVTGNTRHYARIQAHDYALKLDDWRAPI